MRKLVLLFAVIFLFSACNNQNTEPKPDAVRVIKDTLAQTIMRSFNEAPKANRIYVKVDTKDESFLREADAAITGLLSEMKSNPQHFTINPDQPSEVQGEQGTKLAFNPNSFIDADGKEITAPVDIELKECYRISEMLQENVAGAGSLMDSRGMFFVSASSQGQQVKLKTGEEINVRFPFSVQAKDGYRFYYGREQAGAMSWIAEKGKSEPKPFAPKEITRPEFSYHGLELKNYLHETINYPEDAKRNELSAKVEVSFLIDPNGKVTEVSTREAYKIFRNEIARVLSNMPDWKPATYGGKNIPAMVHADIDFNIRRLDQVKIDFVETEPNLVNSSGTCYMEYGSDLKDARNKTSHTQSINKLGWYNSGRPIPSKVAMADVIVRADSKSDIKLILKNRSAITAGENCIGYSRFRNIPVNSEVYVMGIRHNGNQIEYALQAVKLEKETVVSLNWKKGDEASIEQAYKRLNLKS